MKTGPIFASPILALAILALAGHAAHAQHDGLPRDGMVIPLGQPIPGHVLIPDGAGGVMLVPDAAAIDMQKEIVKQVMREDGELTQDQLTQFWRLMPAGGDAGKIQERLQRVTPHEAITELLFTFELWLSARQSLTAKRVQMTPGYDAAKARLLELFRLKNQEAYAAKMFRRSDVFVRAAAEGTPYQRFPDAQYLDPAMNAPFVITEAYLDKGLGIGNGVRERLSRLLDPKANAAP